MSTDIIVVAVFFFSNEDFLFLGIIQRIKQCKPILIIKRGRPLFLPVKGHPSSSSIQSSINQYISVTPNERRKLAAL